MRGGGIPDDVTFATRPQQVREMIGRTRAAGLPFAWFTADEEFGQNPGLREYLETEKIAYVMAVPRIRHSPPRTARRPLSAIFPPG